MNTLRGLGCAVAVLVSVLSSGCGAATVEAPTGATASGGGRIIAADSAPAYQPAAVREVTHHYGERSSGLIAPRRSYHP